MTRQWMHYSLMLQMAVAGVVLAADNTMDTATPSDKASQTSGAIDTSHRDMTQTPGVVRAGKLLGSDVYTRNDKSLASVKDIVLDKNGQRIGYVVLSYGSVVGMGGKLCAVPYKLIEYNPTDKNARIYTSLDEQTLKNAPTFAKDQWPTEANAAYFQKSDEFYSGHSPAGNEPMARDTMKDMGDQAKQAANDTEHAMKQTAPDQGTQAVPAGAKVDTTGLQWTRRASQLIDARVESPDGQRLGEVKDLVLDWRSGDVRYAVLAYGGFMGLGDKLFAVPIDQFKIQPNDNKLVLDVNKDTLKNAPGFESSHWPDMAQPDWDKNITQYYHQNSKTPANP